MVDLNTCVVGGLPERDDVRPVNRASQHDPPLQNHPQHAPLHPPPTRDLE